MIVSDSSCEELNVTDDYGNTPLHWAAEKNQVESVKFLLLQGANPNLRNYNLMAPLHVAAQFLHNEVLKLNKGANLCKSNKWGCFPIHQAAFSGAKKCMEIILKFGEEHGYSRLSHINFVNNGKASPLHMAVQSGDLEMIKMCLDNGAQLDLVEKGKCTALHFAATQGATEIVKLMISSYSGSSDIVNAVDGNQESLLHNDHNGWTALHHASLGGYTQTMKVILDTNMKCADRPDEEGNTALHFAAREGHAKAVALLLSYDADVVLNKQLASFLHVAIHNKRKEVVLTTIKNKRYPAFPSTSLCHQGLFTT
ncbi:hypothetical protein CB1_000850007 [Camelus ferus]|nr:hypothetical protein CB1_000850007 [Camelus ferus]